MKTICLNFLVNQPLELKRYRFFNMGIDHNYLDDTANRYNTLRCARLCYLPMNALLLSLIKETRGKLKVSFTMSGITVEQFKTYAPEVLDSFRALADTGCVEFLGTTYSHSLASLVDRGEFEAQVMRHKQMIQKEFGQTPKAFCNTELIYSDGIGDMVSALGYNVITTEGAKHVLGWKSPNFVYAGAINQRQKVLLRNYKLSDDLVFRFSNHEWNEWPLTSDKYTEWLSESPGEIVNIFADYQTFGIKQEAASGIFDFIKVLPKAILAKGMEFDTVTSTAEKHQPTGVLSCPHPMSWADEERDVTAWLGNELQNEAVSKLYALKGEVQKLNSPDFDYVWSFMQQSHNFYYMATKWLSAATTTGVNPFGSSYEGFINYMNVLSDFEIELSRKAEPAKVVADEKSSTATEPTPASHAPQAKKVAPKAEKPATAKSSKSAKTALKKATAK